MATLFPDQSTLDDALASITPNELQGQMEGVLKPILDLINAGLPYEEILKDLLDAWPDMKAKDIEDMIARAIFISQVWGRISAQ
jgi:phage gp29-like protein